MFSSCRNAAANIAAPGLNRVKEAWEERVKNQDAVMLAAKVNRFVLLVHTGSVPSLVILWNDNHSPTPPAYKQIIFLEIAMAFKICCRNKRIKTLFDKTYMCFIK